MDVPFIYYHQDLDALYYAQLPRGWNTSDPAGSSEKIAMSLPQQEVDGFLTLLHGTNEQRVCGLKFMNNTKTLLKQISKITEFEQGLPLAKLVAISYVASLSAHIQRVASSTGFSCHDDLTEREIRLQTGYRQANAFAAEALPIPFDDIRRIIT